ncbi:hypothetical protein HK101_002435, partial [Irineochytrium annulatum]
SETPVSQFMVPLLFVLLLSTFAARMSAKTLSQLRRSSTGPGAAKVGSAAAWAATICLRSPKSDMPSSARVVLTLLLLIKSIPLTSKPKLVLKVVLRLLPAMSALIREAPGSEEPRRSSVKDGGDTPKSRLSSRPVCGDG